jgi:hypothetical protein
LESRVGRRIEIGDLLFVAGEEEAGGLGQRLIPAKIAGQEVVEVYG